jgi:hypothetical protein
MIVLDWARHASMTAARNAVGTNACVYVQADRNGCPVRVGMATKGLHARYRGGTGWAVDAGMHGSGNVVFVAVVPLELCRVVEETLIWTWREQLPYNNLGKRIDPSVLVDIDHQGDIPAFAQP